MLETYIKFAETEHASGRGDGYVQPVFATRGSIGEKKYGLSFPHLFGVGSVHRAYRNLCSTIQRQRDVGKPDERLREQTSTDAIYVRKTYSWIHSSYLGHHTIPSYCHQRDRPERLETIYIKAAAGRRETSLLSYAPATHDNQVDSQCHQP